MKKFGVVFDEDGRVVYVERTSKRPVSEARIKQRLIAIAKAAKSGDFAAAHSKEDALFVDVLEAIAAGATDAKELATLALKSRTLPFKRVCS